MNRLESHITRVGAISDSQFRFKRAKSTTDAMEEVIKIANGANRGAAQNRDLCVLITLDVRNAFNTAAWWLIDKALKEIRCPRVSGSNFKILYAGQATEDQGGH